MKNLVAIFTVLLSLFLFTTNSYSDEPCPIKIEHEVGQNVQGFNAISLVDNELTISDAKAYAGDKKIDGIYLGPRSPEIDKKGDKTLIFATSDKNIKITKLVVDVYKYGKYEFDIK